MWRDNKVRDRKHGPADPAIAADNGMKGMTENENIHFRWVLRTCQPKQILIPRLDTFFKSEDEEGRRAIPPRTGVKRVGPACSRVVMH